MKNHYAHESCNYTQTHNDWKDKIFLRSVPHNTSLIRQIKS